MICRMPSRPPMHRASGWRPPEPWHRSIGQISNYEPMPRNWPKLRAQVLREEPLCRLCQAKGFVVSREVDHIVPRSQGGTSRRENLQGLCIDCHRRKTDRESKVAQWGR